MSREGRTENGIVNVSSKYSVPETLERLQSVVGGYRKNTMGCAGVEPTAR